jgi:hypothetical protein
MNAARTGMLGELVNKLLSLMKRKKRSENGGSEDEKELVEVHLLEITLTQALRCAHPYRPK